MAAGSEAHDDLSLAPLTREEARDQLARLVQALPLALRVKTVAKLTDMSVDAIYESIAEDRCPWPVLRVGRVIRIPRHAVLASLGLEVEEVAVAGEEEP